MLVYQGVKMFQIPGGHVFTPDGGDPEKKKKKKKFLKHTLPSSGAKQHNMYNMILNSIWYIIYVRYIYTYIWLCMLCITLMHVFFLRSTKWFWERAGYWVPVTKLWICFLMSNDVVINSSYRFSMSIKNKVNTPPHTPVFFAKEL